jgi:GNAT superfamily N-acetyltransferase
MDPLTLRAATLADTSALTDLALRAKASWGYDAAFMEACREELTITPNMLAAWRFWVAELGGVVVGTVALDAEGQTAQLEFFFVDPAHQGLGIGRALMTAFNAACRDLGFMRVEVDADPNAEAIYRRMGYHTVGYAPSGSIPGRMLPRMQLTLS